MKATIEVNSREEANAIRVALANPEVKAFVLVMGNLLPLGETARRRVLQYVLEVQSEEKHDL